MWTDRLIWRFVVRPAVFLALVLGLARPVAAQAQNPFLGSVPAGPATGATLDLSLPDALDRALTANLGVIEGRENTRAAEAIRLRSLNALLTNLAARVSASSNEINPRAQGINLTIPGVTLPAVFGPFGVNDARVSVTQELYNRSDHQGLKASTELTKAAQYTYANDRETVVFTAGAAYLLVIADAAAVDSIQAQLVTAETLYRQDQDKNAHGVVAKIDVLRAQVELQTEQQRLIAAQNQLSIDKLSLARVIGLPNAQEFRLTDTVPYSPLADLTLEQALSDAGAARPDYLGAKRLVAAAELALRASAAEAYPSASVAADYGAIGSPNFGSAHGTFSAGVALAIPIFQGTKVRADRLQASAALEERKAELADLGARIDDQVRTTFYNLTSSSDLVAVAKSNVELAGQTLTQARDRNAAGVADNLEIVQAQESVAAANQSYIASLYAFNVAKLSLAQVLGVAEREAVAYLLGRK
jgi:outer membrane protein TolC